LHAKSEQIRAPPMLGTSSGRSNYCLRANLRTALFPHRFLSGALLRRENRSSCPKLLLSG
jgi:hypothetical protein